MPRVYCCFVNAPFSSLKTPPVNDIAKLSPVTAAVPILSPFLIKEAVDPETV
jgi:hypothetical protein